MEKGESNHVSQSSQEVLPDLFCALYWLRQHWPKGPIKIGVPVGLSGANSVVAPSVVQSAELAVEEINKAGGVLGRTLALEVADDGSGAAGAQKAFDSADLPEKGGRTHQHGDQRGAQRRPAAGSAWKNPLHLHLVL